MRAGGRELHLRRVREGDGGAFTCIVMNSAGQDTLTYTLTVQGMVLLSFVWSLCGRCVLGCGCFVERRRGRCGM